MQQNALSDLIRDPSGREGGKALRWTPERKPKPTPAVEGMTDHRLDWGLVGWETPEPCRDPHPWIKAPTLHVLTDFSERGSPRTSSHICEVNRVQEVCVGCWSQDTCVLAERRPKNGRFTNHSAAEAAKAEAKAVALRAKWGPTPSMRYFLSKSSVGPRVGRDIPSLFHHPLF